MVVAVPAAVQALLGAELRPGMVLRHVASLEAEAEAAGEGQAPAAAGKAQGGSLRQPMGGVTSARLTPTVLPVLRHARAAGHALLLRFELPQDDAATARPSPQSPAPV